MNNINQSEVLDLAPASKESINWKKRIRVSDIEKFWMNSIGTYEMQGDQTARVTGVVPYVANGKLNDRQMTFSEQIRSADELIAVMEKKYKSVDNEHKEKVGFSLSAATYEFRKDEEGNVIRPGISAVQSLSSLVIDIDAHADVKSKGRFHFNSYSDESRKVIGVYVITKINFILRSRNDISFRFVSNATYSTGGGLQYIIKFSRPITGDEATTLFNFLKRALKDLSAKMPVYGFDSMDNLVKSFVELDLSSTDIAHTQRIGGTVNPKEAYLGSFAEEILDFNNHGVLDSALVSFLKKIDETIANDTSVLDKKTLLIIGSSASSFLKKYKDISIEVNGSDILDINSTLHQIKDIRITSEEITAGSSKMLDTPIDYDILSKIDPVNQFEFFESLLEKDKDVHSSLSYVQFRCPFHDERNGSFTVYRNLNSSGAKSVVYAKDNHDGERYNLISFLVAYRKLTNIEYTKTNAIGEIAGYFNIDMSSATRKMIHKDESTGTVEDLLARINVEDFVYYRLANKQRACIIREFENGESFTFDGTRMMSDHILLHQLNVKDAGGELRQIFHDKFITTILVNAFEEFEPGRDYMYQRSHIQYINLWIPGDNYRRIHKLAESIDVMDIASLIEIIKDRLPYTNFFLHQITQKGSLEYLINWLISVSKFKIMPTIPIMVSVQGTGKNVFVTHMMEYYLNSDYVNLITSDKLSSNFNSFMQTSNLIVLDEGNYNKASDADLLKYYSGNNTLQLEKKGIDSMKVKKHFNFIMFSNTESPMKHPSDDRRVTYFRLDATLKDTVKYAGCDDIGQFIDEMREEMTEFWALITKTKHIEEWSQNNLKDNQFNRQILLMHPFGRLLIKIVENKWDDISLQMNENIDDGLLITANLEMVEAIKEEYNSFGTIDLPLINRYIKSLSSKSYTGVQQFIDTNALHKSGITYTVTKTSVKIVINKAKAKALITMDNNLGKLYDDYKSDKIEKTLRAVNDHSELDSMDEPAGLEAVTLNPLQQVQERQNKQEGVLPLPPVISTIKT